MATFRIQDTEFSVAPWPSDDVLPIDSSPRPYSVVIDTDSSPMRTVDRMVDEAMHPLVLIDEQIVNLHSWQASSDLVVLPVAATEEFKSVEGAFSVIEFLDSHRISRSSMVIAVGGGIVQDVAAFACCVYKRGVPWAYVPTTLLAQADSCIGAKSGLNYKGAKNLVGVFSAPRRVSLNPEFLATLPLEDLLSGLGEIFRLSIIGGNETLALFEELEEGAISGEVDALYRLIRSALSVKRAVVEGDEFERDLRRSMNFGHSIGHALEALTDHQIPHGIAVAVGVLVESEISRQRGLLAEADLDTFFRLGRLIVPDRVRSVLAHVAMTNILEVLFRDKKVEGSTLKLVVPEGVGQIRFIDLALDGSAATVIENALAGVLNRIA